ncbi:MAG: RDD family protein [Gemmatimonadaceae bacterium]
MTHAPVAEAVDLASLPQRLAAQFLDGLVAAAAPIAAFLLTFVLHAVGIVLIVLACIFAFLYTLLADGLEGGQSYGKRMVGIRVVSMQTGAPCSFGQSFIRNLLLMLLGPIDWIFIFGDRRQRLGDKAAGTIVIVD